MHMRVYCLAAMFIFAISGCMSTRSGSPPVGPAVRVNCPMDKCEPFEVRVVETGGGGCKVDSVSIPTASVVGQPAGEKALTWVLSGADGSPYEFSREEWKFAITFKDDGADPSGKFKDAKVPGNGKRLTITFLHGAPQDASGYSYGLTVRRSSNKQFCTTLDPWFVG